MSSIPASSRPDPLGQAPLAIVPDQTKVASFLDPVSILGLEKLLQLMAERSEEEIPAEEEDDRPMNFLF